jgi:subtilisin-like proprotein convertase family protein
MIQNDGQQKFPDVGAKLISTDPLFDITKAESEVGDIDSGEARQARGLAMKVSESAPCGAKLPFALGAHIGDAEKWYNDWIYVGEPTLSPTWRDDERTTVDGYYTVVRELHVDEDYPVRRVNVNLHFDTQHANFFKITMMAPSGEQNIIHDRKQTEQFEVKGLFDFMAASDGVRGTWRLVMENYNTIPGELISWDLTFADYHCR